MLRGLGSSVGDQADARRKIRRNLIGPVIYSAATLIALRYPRVSVIIYFLLAAFYFIPTRQPARVLG